MERHVDEPTGWSPEICARRSASTRRRNGCPRSEPRSRPRRACGRRRREVSVGEGASRRLSSLGVRSSSQAWRSAEPRLRRARPRRRAAAHARLSSTVAAAAWSSARRRAPPEAVPGLDCRAKRSAPRMSCSLPSPSAGARWDQRRPAPTPRPARHRGEAPDWLAFDGRQRMRDAHDVFPTRPHLRVPEIESEHRRAVRGRRGYSPA